MTQITDCGKYLIALLYVQAMQFSQARQHQPNTLNDEVNLKRSRCGETFITHRTLVMVKYWFSANTVSIPNIVKE